jgi:aryl-alcohol dehydrogenase-like predicted oxidoreductase
MRMHALGNTGFNVSALGIGSCSNADVYRLMLDAGANVVDTAQCYGEHEAFLGDTLRHRRREFVLVSKCGHHDVLPDGSWRSRAISMADVDGALRRLRTDHLDVMLLHSYDYDLLEKGDAVRVLADAKRAGKIRFAGYSGDNDRAVLAANLPEIDVIEASVSVADQHQIGLLLPVTARRGIGVIAKRPTTSGAWRLLADDPVTYATSNNRAYVERLLAMRLTPAAFGVPGDAAPAWLELCLRFNLAVEGVHTSIVSTNSPAHAQANLDAIAKGPLPAEQFESLRRLFRESQAAGGKVWRGEN